MQIISLICWNAFIWFSVTGPAVLAWSSGSHSFE